MSQKRSFLRWEPALDEGAVKIVDETINDLGCYINLVEKAVGEFERIDSSSERSSTVGRVRSNRIACYREIGHERKSQQPTSLSYS